MAYQKQHPFFRSVLVIVLCALVIGASHSATAQAPTKQAELVSDLTETALLYLPVIMKNYDARIFYDVFLPVIAKEVVEEPPPGDWDILMRETFEGDFPTSPWWVEDRTGLGYEWAKRNCQQHGGSYSAWAVGGGVNGSLLSCNSHYPDNVETWMIYGPFSLADPEIRQAELVFWRFLNMQFGDEFKWMASTDGVNFYGAGTYAFEYWKKFVFDLSAVPTLGDLTDEPEVYIAFVFKSNSSGTLAHGAYVDDIVIQTCDGSCSPTTSSLPVSEVYETSEILE